MAEMSVHITSIDLVAKLTKSCHYKSIVLLLFAKYEKFQKSVADICDVENRIRIKDGFRAVQPWVCLFFP